MLSRRVAVVAAVVICFAFWLLSSEWTPPTTTTASESNFSGPPGGAVPSRVLPTPIRHSSPPDLSVEAVRGCASSALPRFPIVLLENTMMADRFLLACYEDNDIVCNTIRSNGHWEAPSFNLLRYVLDTVALRVAKTAAPPLYIDIGGNVGSLAVGVAMLGYETHVFEMMPKNAQLLTVSRCVNRIGSGMHIHHTGLGPTNTKCFMVTSTKNFGDAALDCDPTLPERLDAARARGEASDYTIVDSINVQPLDQVFEAQGLFARMDQGEEVVVKIDVEGSEIRVFQGATRLLSHPNRPKLILSEVWKLINVTSYAELMITKFGYIGYSLTLRRWMPTVASATQFHTEMTPIEDILWVHPGFVQHLVGQHLFGADVPPQH